MPKSDEDLESGADKVPLLQKGEPESARHQHKQDDNEDRDNYDDSGKDAMSSIPHTDIKEAAFWLFMLFLASVTMTVGNKVRNALVEIKTFLSFGNVSVVGHSLIHPLIH